MTIKTGRYIVNIHLGTYTEKTVQTLFCCSDKTKNDDNNSTKKNKTQCKMKTQSNMIRIR